MRSLGKNVSATLLALSLTAVGSSACYAQGKQACELVTKADAESVLGVTLEQPRPYAPFRSLLDKDFTKGRMGDGCEFTNVAPGRPRPPKVISVSIEVRYSPSPDNAAVEQVRKEIAERTYEHPVDVPGLGDAALWIGPANNLSLFVFAGGKMTLMIGPSQASLEQVKAIALKALGGSGKTGYVYGLQQSALARPALNKAGAKPSQVDQTAPASKTTAAAPLPTAPKGIVHESRAYWGAYRSDIIRQVFEGDFGRHVDSSTQFRVLFNSYVESFSKSCHAYLPARHEAVTLSQVTTKKDGHGNVISRQDGQSWTVDVDSRFVPEYREYAASLGGTSGETLAGALSVMSGRVSASAYFDPGTDIDKFFETETCQSAAMRQLTENLLRAAKGRDSLQDAGDPNIVRVCVPANLVENHSWNSPPPGGKMEAFKNAVRKIARDETRSKGLENPLFWVVERPANGGADLFDTFDPATSDPRRLVMVGGAGRDAHCTVGSYALTLPINP